jgi:quinoprotein glucose dehydrogenase
VLRFRTGKHLWTFVNVVRGRVVRQRHLAERFVTYSGNSGTWSLVSGDEEARYVYLPLETATGDYSTWHVARQQPVCRKHTLCHDARTGKRGLALPGRPSRSVG